ncbi:SIR2 family protein [Novacetimonas hansenii]|uniref:SIR2 family protein n=1 Tax=Novacetimonas hansenii TaxID=436 RepID=UPI00248D50BA|nr:SIR2 family protein [Novacetimonas hansenii]
MARRADHHRWTRQGLSGPEEGFPVILLHGWPDDALTWNRLLPDLHATGFRTYVPWLRGCGPTCFREADIPRNGQLEQLGAALWDRSQFKGAAVMVGAGFSRNAELIGRDVGKPPLWGDLREAMVSKLYKSCPEAAPFDPLRLAEEFRTYLGQAALNDFVREQVPDASWRPGRMHFKLMALPWADVLTTNYDTLLERASKRHNVVMDAIDLSTVRRPRIIKLHGSVDRNARLVIAEEDYRVYPRKSAAFVNTARQVFLENELCLIGFSGDDPNFLQWSGWVRDHLGDHARRIYLVGSLNLRPAKRRLLESRNIAPIDFSPLTISLPREEAEARACELFLDYLLSKEPVRAMDWMPLEASAYSFATTNRASLKTHLDEPTTAKDLLEKLDLVWKSDRESCPDWLVMPGRVRRAVAFGTSLAPWGYVRALEYLDRPERNPAHFCWSSRSHDGADPVFYFVRWFVVTSSVSDEHRGCIRCLELTVQEWAFSHALILATT